MARIALAYRHYPLSVARFFRRAFLRLGHEVRTIGPFEPTIPWQPGTDYARYWDIPDIEIFPEGGSYPMAEARAQGLEAWKPDALVMIDAGFHLAGGWNKVPIALVATDPHCLNYHEQAKSANAFFVMQEHYLHKYLEGAGHAGYWPPPEWLPYCYDPQIHYWAPGIQPEYDVAFVGVLYPERQRMLEALEHAGLKVLARQGVLYEEGTALYAQGKVALNLSSRLDLPMRFWEGLAYRRLVFTNRVPDLALLEGQGCHPYMHYIPYESTYDESKSPAAWVIPDLDDLIAKLRLYCGDAWEEEGQRIADAGYVWVQPHTYEARAKRILESLGVR